MDARHYAGDEDRDYPSVEDREMPDACPHCDARDGEPHIGRCPLADYPFTEQQKAEKQDRARHRRMQAQHASRTQIAAWLRKHAKGMQPDSHNALYLQRAADLIEKDAHQQTEAA